MPPKRTAINGIIYKTTNLLNGMWYIGKDEKDDPKYLGSGTYLSRAIAKYGKDNFIKEILDTATTSEKLSLLEVEYIKKYSATEDSMCYNIAAGGNGGNTVSGMDDIDKLRFSSKMKESWQELTVEAKQTRVSSMHNSTRNKEKSQSHKDKISKSKKGVKQSQSTIDKKREISKKLYTEGKICPPKNDWTGKTHSKESKIKMSNSKKGIKNIKSRLFSPDEQLKIKELYRSGVRTGIIAEMFLTSGPTILRYVREPD